MSQGQAPVKSFRMGKIECGIWQRPGEHGMMYTCKFSRNYNVNGQWQRTDSMNADDLPIIALLAQTASIWIMTQRDLARGQGNGNGNQSGNAGTHPQGVGNAGGGNRGGYGNPQQPNPGTNPPGGYFPPDQLPEGW